MADKPFTLDQNKLFTLPGMLLISIVALAGGIGVGFANMKAQVNEVPAIKARLDDHDKALGKLDVMANDISWIKQELLRKNREDARRADGTR